MFGLQILFSIFESKNMQKITISDLQKIHEYLYEIPKSYRNDMRVPAQIFVNEAMLLEVLTDKSLEQIVNVASLPGIVKAAIAMPDIHQGYGFPIGGVAATDINNGGVISPGGIGYDINCGVRLLVSNINQKEIKPHIEKLATSIFNTIPSGVGRSGKLKVNKEELDRILRFGVEEMIRLGYGIESDQEFCESNGKLIIANPDMVSEQAKKRGSDQIGTLGSGNHFLEIQYVDKIYDEKAARAFNLSEGLVTVMIHCGSRGLGHQVCTDYVKLMINNAKKWNITLPDRELICAPFISKEGQEYYHAMAAASNFAWANRHVIAHWVRNTWQKILGESSYLNLVYDVAHNIGKQETHTINGQDKELLVHRKGATRAFGPHHKEIPQNYQQVGQPVLIPGTMGTASYVLAGNKESMEISFGTSCHGAGRRMSRIKAKQSVKGNELREQLEAKGIIIRCDSQTGLSEEAPVAYKDIDNVVSVIENAKIARRVARLRPLAVIKGD